MPCLAWLTPPSVYECVHEWVNVRQCEVHIVLVYHLTLLSDLYCFLALPELAKISFASVVPGQETENKISVKNTNCRIKTQLQGLF